MEYCGFVANLAKRNLVYSHINHKYCGRQSDTWQAIAFTNGNHNKNHFFKVWGQRNLIDLRLNKAISVWSVIITNCSMSKAILFTSDSVCVQKQRVPWGDTHIQRCVSVTQRRKIWDIEKIARIIRSPKEIERILLNFVDSRWWWCIHSYVIS